MREEEEERNMRAAAPVYYDDGDDDDSLLLAIQLSIQETDARRVGGATEYTGLKEEQKIDTFSATYHESDVGVEDRDYQLAILLSKGVAAEENQENDAALALLLQEEEVREQRYNTTLRLQYKHLFFVHFFLTLPLRPPALWPTP